MSKLVMVKALDDSQPQLQIVQAVTNLETQVHTLRMMLDALPQAVANQTAELLEPLENLRTEVLQAITAYDQVTAAQRQSLDELTNEMINKASQTFEQKVVELDKTISDLSQNLPPLTSSIDKMIQVTQNIERIPDRLKKSAEELTATADELIEAARSTRPKLWRQAVGLILAGAVGAMLVATGQVALNRLLPPSAVQQKANLLALIESKATPQEIELLNQIVNRPAK